MTPRAVLARARSVVAPLVGDRELRAYYLTYAAVWFAAEAYAQALPLYFQEVGVSLAVLGFARSAANAANVVVEAPAGLLVDSVDRATVAAVAALALAVVLAALPLARTPAALVAVVVAVALARQVLNNNVTPAISEAVPDERAGLGWGLRDVGIYVGGALGLAVAGVVTARSGTVSVAFLPGAFAVLLAAAVVWVRAADRTLSPASLPSGPSPQLAREWGRSLREGFAEASPVADFRAVSNWGVLARFCVVEALVTSASGLSFFLLPAFAADLGFDPAVVLALFGASNLFGAPLSLVGGALADRYSRKWLYVGNYAAETAMLAAFALAGGRSLFLVGLGLFVVQTTFEPAVLAYFFDQFEDDEAGRAWSVEGVVARATGVVAPAVGGALYTVEPRLVFVVGTVLMATGTLVAVTLPE